MLTKAPLGAARRARITATATRHAEILILGGGILGCSIAYHLTRAGKRDVVILEKSGLTHGATWHAAGLVGQLRSSRNTTRMLKHSVELYDRLEAETGQAIDWKKFGSLRLACSEQREMENRRLMTMAKSFDLEMQWLSPQQSQELFPLMSTEDVRSAIFIPSDGYIDPASVAQALAKGAKDKGAKIVIGERAIGFTVENERVTRIETDKGAWTCDLLVNACGMWGHEVGQLAGVRVPSFAVEHQYLITDPIPDAPKRMPTMRDPDHLVYYKPEVRGLVVGGYEPDTQPFAPDGIPRAFAQELLPGNFDRFEQLAQLAAKRTPIVNQVGVRQLLNGPIPYSADGDFVMGKAPELANYFVCAGFLYGIAAGGGAGRMMAEWIIDGRPSLNLWPLDIRRFGFHHATRHFMYARAVELYGGHYKFAFPAKEHETQRGIRRSPLYETLKAQGAVFGSRGGWERPNWFAPKGIEAKDKPDFDRAKTNWFKHVGEEHKAVRERVALIDQTSFSKFELMGEGVVPFLQRMAVSNMDRPVGSVIYTQLCNERGGIECDLTFTRVAQDRYYFVTGAAFGKHDAHWIQSHSAPRRHRAAGRRDLGARRDQSVRTQGARGAAAGGGGGCLQRRLPVRHHARDHGRRGAGARHPHRLCRRAGLGTARADRVCRACLRAAARSGRDARHRRRRLSRHRFPAHGKGLSLLVQRHHAGLFAAGGRARLPGQLQQGRFRRPRRSAEAARRRREAAAGHLPARRLSAALWQRGGDGRTARWSASPPAAISATLWARRSATAICRSNWSSAARSRSRPSARSPRRGSRPRRPTIRKTCG